MGFSSPASYGKCLCARWQSFKLPYDWFNGWLGIGLFDNRDVIDLGSPIEFRTGIELTYLFKKGYRLGVAGYHLSNSRLSKQNPGTEAFTITFLVPIVRNKMP